MYGKVNLLYVWRKNMNNVDDLRYKMFLKTYDVQSEKFFDIVKIFDASKSPPCKVELEQQVLRAAYVANIWQNAYQRSSPALEPLMFGWKLCYENGRPIYTFNWFDGDQFPPTVKDVILDEDSPTTGE